VARKPIPTWCFVLVAVHLEGHFLVVHERKHGQLWYLPAGRVEPGESLIAAAERETLEETGVSVAITGIVRLEHSPRTDGTARLRVVFTARPRGDITPKSEPDEHSLEAAWVTLRDLDRMPLRGEDVKQIFEYVARNGPVYPLDLITAEGAPWVKG
jgi:phosphatase NudJ